MIKKFMTVAVAVTALGLTANFSKAAESLLGTTFYPIELITSSADLNQASFSATDAFGTGSAVTLFTSPFYNATPPTQSLTFVPGTGNASAFAALLTNGLNDLLQLSINLRNSADVDSAGTFTNVFEKERFNRPGNDFAGNTISRIVFNLTSLTFTPTAGGTTANFNANLQVFGELTPVPEPGMLLGGIAMMTMTGLCRPRRNKAA